MTPGSLTLAALAAFVAVLVTSYLHEQARERDRDALIESAKDRALLARRDGQCFVLCVSGGFTVVDVPNSNGTFKCLCADNTVIERSDK